MALLDWVIVVAYLLGMVGLSVWLGRGQKDAVDYYVGGRELPWWALGISTMATQSSANSFIGIPAYVALAVGGGLAWLQYELAVPIAMIFILLFLLPFFRSLKLVTVYEYLEYRFGPGTRYFLSGVFLIARGVGTGAGVYAASIVVSVCFSIPVWSAILLIGLVTIIYDTIGGMKMVVYSDVVQLFVLLFGLFLCIYYVMGEVGGWSEMIGALSPERWKAVDMSTGLGDGGKAPFWAFLIGGFFLYASYYGVDQSQAQRALSAPTIEDTRRALVFNGLARFPLTVLYLLLGVASAAAYLHIPGVRESVPANHPDYLVPQVILQVLPTGLRAVLLAALLAAAMSSLDSALNSLSAVTVRDFIARKKTFEPRKMLIVSKLTTVVWGILITLFALCVDTESPVVVTINKIGSAFYGPILAAFVLGVLSKRINSYGVVAGVLVGVGANLTIWVTKAPIYWMWWNFIGFVGTVAAAYAVSLVSAPPAEATSAYTLKGARMFEKQVGWGSTYAILVGQFLLILGTAFLITRFTGTF